MTVWQYVTAATGTIHLRTSPTRAEMDPPALCGYHVSWDATGDETLSGIAATCKRCRKIVGAPAAVPAPGYRVTFERIGRNRHVPAKDFASVRDADELAERIWRFSHNHLASGEVGVTVDLEDMTGNIYAGGRPAGTFTIERTTS